MKKIKLIGAVDIPPIVGQDGVLISVNAENQTLAKTLVEIGSAREVKLPDDDDEEESGEVGSGPQVEKLDPSLIPAAVLEASKAETAPGGDAGSGDTAAVVASAPEVAVENRGADAAPLAVEVATPEVVAEVKPTTTGKLKSDDSVAKLAEFSIHGRYIKALTDANAKTIGELAAHQDKIVEVPGISPAAAEQIKKVIAENLA